MYINGMIIEMNYAALMKIDVMATDIRNAYIK